MEVVLTVPGDRREVLDAIYEFFKGRKDLYKTIYGPSWVTGWAGVTTEVHPQHERFGGFLSIILGLVSLVFMSSQDEPRLKVFAKTEKNGVTRFKITTEYLVKPEAAEPLVTWLVETHGAVEV